MRSVNRDSSALETINAASNAIASGDSRVSRATAPKKRFGGCWSMYWCFGSQRHNKRIGHAVLVPETSSPETDVPAPSSSNQAPSNSISLPFIAPPSSPASFLQSGPSSTAQSPTGLFMSASMYSPGPASIFAIGPYAYETQLVSPPVFSTFTTEPSTAPFTPPPESVHLTTPSSPEVPFAQGIDPNHGFSVSYREFQAYQFQPGSPIGQLISPSSGTASPFPDGEFAIGGPNSLVDRVGGPPKPLNLDGPSFEAMPRRDRAMNLIIGERSYEHENRDEDAPADRRHRKNPSMSLGSVKEFNFGNVNVDGGDFSGPTSGPETKSWAFFPMIQPGVS